MARPRSRKPSKACHVRLIQELLARVDSNHAVPADANSALIIHDADMYAADPVDLTNELESVVAEDGEMTWYLVNKLKPKDKSKRKKQRETPSGVWHGEGKSTDVLLPSKVVIGHHDLFTFYERKGTDKVKTEWRMTEYRLTNDKEQSLVLCKISAIPKKVKIYAEEEVDAPAAAVAQRKSGAEKEKVDAAAAAVAQRKSGAEKEKVDAAAAVAQPKSGAMEGVYVEKVLAHVQEELAHKKTKNVRAMASVMVKAVKKKTSAMARAEADALEVEAMSAVSEAVIAAKAAFAAASQLEVDADVDKEEEEKPYAEDEVAQVALMIKGRNAASVPRHMCVKTKKEAGTGVQAPVHKSFWAILRVSRRERDAEEEEEEEEEEEDAYAEGEVTVSTMVHLIFEGGNVASVAFQVMNMVTAFVKMEAKGAAFAWDVAVRHSRWMKDLINARKVTAWAAHEAEELMEDVVDRAATEAEGDKDELVLECMGASPENKAYYKYGAAVNEFDLALARLGITNATAPWSNLPQGIEKGPGSKVSKSMLANKSLLLCNKTSGRDFYIKAFGDDFILKKKDREVINFIKCSYDSNIVVTIDDFDITVLCLKPNVNRGHLYGHVIDAYVYIATINTHDISVLTTTESQQLSEEYRLLDWEAERGSSWLKNLGKRCVSPRMVFVPVNARNIHWYLLVLNFERNEIQILDSKTSQPDLRDEIKENSLVKNLQACIDSAVEAGLLTLTEPINITQWEKKPYTDIPQQTDNDSCGAYIIRYILDWNGFDMRADFTQEQIDIFRQKICCRLLLSEYNKKREPSYRTPITESDYWASNPRDGGQGIASDDDVIITNSSKEMNS